LNDSLVNFTSCVWRLYCALLSCFHHHHHHHLISQLISVAVISITVDWQFGESQKLRLVRILRSTVMVRVGGGWVALDEFLVKNDPCRGLPSTLPVIFFLCWTLL